MPGVSQRAIRSLESVPVSAPLLRSTARVAEVPSVPARVEFRSRWVVATAVMCSAVMEVLDASVVNVSLPLCAPDYAHHGPHIAGDDGLRYQPLQRDAQHRVEHGDFFCHHLGRPAFTVSSGHSLGPRQRVQSGQQATLLSFTDVFHLMGVLFLAIIPLILLMRKEARPAPGAIQR